MRILILNYRDRTHPLAGGAEVHLHRIFQNLVAKGHEVILWTTHYKGAKKEEWIHGIHVIRKGGDIGFAFHVAFGLRKMIRKMKPDILFEDLNKLPFYSPILVPNFPKVIQLHHLWGFSIFKEACFPIAFLVWLHEQMIPILYKKEKFAVVSPSTFYELNHMGIPKSQIVVIYNGIEEEWIDLENSKVKDDYYLWLGRLRKYKGVWIALKAFELYHRKGLPGKLVFAGDGPERKAMERWVRKQGLENSVVILGSVDHDKKKQLLRNALALIQTSFKEGWGLTVVEAVVCGTTTIASRVAGLQDSVNHGETGILVDRGNVAGFAEAMERMQKSPELRKKLELRAKSWVTRFSWEKAAHETLHLLHTVHKE
jgi:glycosyltransferase involved in cell wall biosynthesis